MSGVYNNFLYIQFWNLIFSPHTFFLLSHSLCGLSHIKDSNFCTVLKASASCQETSLCVSVGVIFPLMSEYYAKSNHRTTHRDAKGYLISRGQELCYSIGNSKVKVAECQIFVKEPTASFP